MKGPGQRRVLQSPSHIDKDILSTQWPALAHQDNVLEVDVSAMGSHGWIFTMGDKAYFLFRVDDSAALKLGMGDRRNTRKTSWEAAVQEEAQSTWLGLGRYKDSDVVWS